MWKLKLVKHKVLITTSCKYTEVIFSVTSYDVLWAANGLIIAKESMLQELVFSNANRKEFVERMEGMKKSVC